MKTKDLIYLCAAVVIFAIAGVVLYSQLGSKGSAASGSPAGGGVSVEVVAPIPSKLDQSVLSQLTDPIQTRDFAAPLDLTHGLGNPEPFNPL